MPLPSPSASLLDEDKGNYPRPLTREERQEVEVSIKYEGYIKRQTQQVQQFHRLEGKLVHPGIDYSMMKGISTEARQKLTNLKPTSIGQASRISGVSPADISVLLLYLEQYRRKAQNEQ